MFQPPSCVLRGLGPNTHTSRPTCGPLASSHRSSVPFCNLQLRLLPFKTPFLFLLGGRHCETFVDVCPQKPCLNGGTCAVASNMPDGFICRCPPVSALLLSSVRSVRLNVVFPSSMGRVLNFSSVRRQCLSFLRRAVETLPEMLSSLICDLVFGGTEEQAQEELGCALDTGLVSLTARSSAGGQSVLLPR